MRTEEREEGKISEEERGTVYIISRLVTPSKRATLMCMGVEILFFKPSGRELVLLRFSSPPEMNM